MGAFTKISAGAFSEIQVDVGVILNTFDIENPTVTDETIEAATTGGVTVNCVPNYSDWGEDIDNCPNNTKELKHLDYWDCNIGYTSVTATGKSFKRALGAADFEESTGKITPRMQLKSEDFEDLWWVGDKTDGGLCAVNLKNALSTGGLALTTTKNGKGQLAMTITGHISLDDPTVVPMEFYVADGTNIAEISE